MREVVVRLSCSHIIEPCLQDCASAMFSSQTLITAPHAAASTRAPCVGISGSACALVLAPHPEYAKPSYLSMCQCYPSFKAKLKYNLHQKLPFGFFDLH